MAMLAGIIIFGIAFVFIVIIGILIYLLFQWNIPTVILRYQGNKQRPQIHITKSRQKKTNELLNKIGLDSSCVNFEFNDYVYNNIILNAIDDTDVDFFMQEVARVDS